MKILVIQQKMIGDVLTSSILFEILRKKYTDARLDYLINEHTLPVVENNPFVDNYVLFTKDVEISKKALLGLANKIKKSEYDIVIDVYSKLSSNLISLFSKAPIRISYYKRYTTFIYSNSIKRLTSTNKKQGLAIINRMQLLSPLGISTNQVIKPKIYLLEEEKEEARIFLNSNGIDLTKPLYMISVLGSGENKTYPFDYMAQVIDTIVDQTNGQILFNYIPKQESEARQVFDLCKETTQSSIFFDVFGKSLRDFLAITYYCNALIGNEGGAVNMAKALKKPTFTIFSPWIDKATWSLFEDENNISVHLKDYKSELYDGLLEKRMKPQALSLYQKFRPDFFIEKLKFFLRS